MSATSRRVSGDRDEALVLGFPDYRGPARRLADAAGLAHAEIELHHFPDGESRIRLPATLPRHVILCRSLDRPNDKLVELELAAATALELGASRLTLVAPYLCYMRQDTAFHRGEAVSQRIVGQLLARHFDTVVTVDPHLHRTSTLDAAVPVRQAIALSAAPAMAELLRRRGDRPLLIGPDAESAQWVGAIGRRAGLDFAVAHKRRLDDRSVVIDLPELDCADRDVVLIDDIISTGETLCEAARGLAARGARAVDAVVTHALFTRGTAHRLHDAGIRDFCSSDSIPHASNAMPLAGLLADALADALAQN
jgi:ribose-phosphate pyrophosphokinase